MAFNGSGVFNRLFNWVTDKNNSIPITSSRMDSEMDGFATGLSNCITKDGQTTVTENIPLNTNKLTGVGDPTAAQDVATKNYVDNNIAFSGNEATITSVADDDVMYLDDTSDSGNGKKATLANILDALLNSFRGLSSVVAGDLFYADGSNTVERLAKGAGGTTLKMNAGATAPEWVDSPIAPSLHVEDVKTATTDGGTFTSGSYQTRDLNTEARNALTDGGVVFELAYDAQSSNFTVGATLTGGTSTATAIIVADADGGATGTLKVIKIDGTFADNETITDDASGSATSNIPSGVVAANQVYLAAGTYHAEGRAPGYRVGNHKSRLQNITATSTIRLGTDETVDPTTAGQTHSFISYTFTLGTGSLIELQHQCALDRATDGFGFANTFGDAPTYSALKFWKIT